MPDYSKGKIYTIRNRDDDTKIYVGSTIQSLAVRFGGHKRDSEKERCRNILLYKEVNGDWTNWYIELYENYSCSSREELLKKEGEVIRLIGTLNFIIAGRDYKQYCVDNKDKIKEQKKQYQKQNYIANVEIIKEKHKQYRIDNVLKEKERHKKYYIENAEKIKERSRLYQSKKKEEKSQQDN
jgi:hypothetical protein